jgi:hypothetical protein
MRRRPGRPIRTQTPLMQISPHTPRAYDAPPAARTPAADALPTDPSGVQGGARPGDVLSLPGGAIVRDVNVNGLVDGDDDVLRAQTLPGPGRRLDVRG